jgi:hypothetical protein
MMTAQSPVKAELGLADTEDFTAKTGCKFAGTSNPRYIRALHGLLHRPLTREQLDRAAGASNGPELVAELRRRGLELPCTLTPVVDRDGRAVRRGIYFMTAVDRRKVREFLSGQTAEPAHD